jgi:hypothetical protein
MAHKKRHPVHRKSYNIVNSSVNSVKNTSKKYMPKVKHSLENLGSTVVKTGSKSVPYLQQLTRRFFNMFTRNKTIRHRKH